MHSLLQSIKDVFDLYFILTFLEFWLLNILKIEIKFHRRQEQKQYRFKY